MNNVLTKFLGSGDLVQFCAKLIVLFLCFPIHECAHAWMADKLGDPTGRNRGRITLNPLKHLDPWGTAMIFIFGVGYAKPVPVRSGNFKHPKRDFALTALAGPVSNLLMAILLLLLVRFLRMIPAGGAAWKFVIKMISYGARINISLAVFNMIPIPPLDGFRVLSAFLPDGAYETMRKSGKHVSLALLFGIFYLSRMGYLPIWKWSSGLYKLLYGVIVK